MTDNEKRLIEIIKRITNKTAQAIILQSYIQANGPVSDEAGNIIKDLLKVFEQIYKDDDAGYDQGWADGYAYGISDD